MRYLYMRASTNELKQSFARQEKFGVDNNIPKENWFREYASGAKNDRTKLNGLLSLLKENDELYVMDASRLTRSMKYLKSTLNFGTKWYDFNFVSMYNKMQNFNNPNEMPKEMEFYTYDELSNL